MSTTEDFKGDDFIAQGLDVIKQIFLQSERLESREFNAFQESMRRICILSRTIYDRLEENPSLVAKVSGTLPEYMGRAGAASSRITGALLSYEQQKESGSVGPKEKKVLFDRSLSLLENLKKSFEKMLDRLFTEDLLDFKSEIELLNTMIRADGLFDMDE